MADTTETTGAAPPQDADAFRAAALAEMAAEGDDSDGAPPGATKIAAADDDAGDGASSDDADADDDGSPGDDGDDDDADPPETAAELPADLARLKEAMGAGDPERFIAALGDDLAEQLLGSKAHKALRQTAKEIRKTRENLVKSAEALKEKFGDPAAARAAASKGPEGADEFVAAVERFFGAPWADCIKYVNASFSGKPARLEAKTRQEREARTAAETQRREAAARVREDITTVVKKDSALFAAHPAVVDLVFAKMQADFRRGIDTPAKALAAVKRDLEAQHKALSKVFAAQPAGKKTTAVRPPSEPSGKRGRAMTEEEFRQEFVRQFKAEKRAAKRAK